MSEIKKLSDYLEYRSFVVFANNRSLEVGCINEKVIQFVEFNGNVYTMSKENFNKAQIKSIQNLKYIDVYPPKLKTNKEEV